MDRVSLCVFFCLFVFLNIYLLILAARVLVAAQGIFMRYVGSFVVKQAFHYGAQASF